MNPFGFWSHAPMSVEVPNPEQTESKPLNTELETLTPETAAEEVNSSAETQTPETALTTTSVEQQQHTGAEPDYDAADFAAALASFDREQAAERAAAQNLTAEEAVITGTVVKVTDKHVVVDFRL